MHMTAWFQAFFSRRAAYRNRRKPFGKCSSLPVAFQLERLEDRTLLSVDIVFNYSLDTNNFFDAATHADRRQVLDLAAQQFEPLLSDNLLAIQPSGGNIWAATFSHPGTGALTQQTNMTISANTLVVFAGGRNLGGTLGIGGPGGFSASGTSAWLDLVKGRGQAGALALPATDFGPWGGAVTFDTTSNWHFGTTTAGLDSSEFDFYSVALHELEHALGFGTSDSWNALVSTGTFTGPNAVAQYDGIGNVPLSVGDSHWVDGTTDEGQEAIMGPRQTDGTRNLATPLDLAALADIGWDVSVVVNPTGTAVGVFTGGNWSLDLNRNDTLNSPAETNVWSFGGVGDIPVSGDWNGDGVDDPGVYDPAAHAFHLDLNTNGLDDQLPVTFDPGIPGIILTPVVGDWNGDGTDDVGVYSSGYWLRDIDGNHLLDATDWGVVPVYGASGLIPVAGDWNGDGDDNLGVYAASGPYAGSWAIDTNENNVLDGADVKAFGLAGFTPVVGDWTADGSDGIGVFASSGPYAGYWARDVNENGQWDATDAGALAQFGTAGDTPVVGNWPAGTPLRLAATPAADSSLVEPLSDGDLSPIVDAAVTVWTDAGVSDGGWSSVTISIADLPGSYLGLTTSSGIVIDVDAAGNGWFVDRTPLQNEEFTKQPGNGELTGLGPIGSQVDLLTVMTHEFGHVLGLPHDSHATAMSDQLAVGIRRTVSADLIDVAFSSGWNDFLDL